MPKYNLDLNLEDAGVAEGFPQWDGEIPPNGAYMGKLKICQLAYASERAKNPGAPMLKIGVELFGTPEKKYDGYVTFRNLVLIESTRTFVNQFLQALTDGSQAQLAKLQKGFKSMNVDQDQKNVLAIANLKINSPQGELPIKVDLKQRTYTPEGGEPIRSSQINRFLLSANGSAGGQSTPDEPVAEDDADTDEPQEVDMSEDADESIFDEE